MNRTGIYSSGLALSADDSTARTPIPLFLRSRGIRINGRSDVRLAVTCSGSCDCSPSSGQGSGKITDGSGDYSNDEDCSWLISSSTEIRLSFTSFDTEAGYDYVTINRCTSSLCSSVEQIARLSGSMSSSKVYTSSTGYLQVLFTSDDSVLGSGFVATWGIVVPYSTMPIGSGAPLPMPGTQECGNWTKLSDNHEDSAAGPLGRMGAHAVKFMQPSGEEALMFFGGAEYDGRLPTQIWKYVPVKASWSIMPFNDGPQGRIHHSMVRVTHKDGASRIVLFAGQDFNGMALQDMWICHPESNDESKRWLSVNINGPHVPQPRYGHAMVTTNRSTLMMFGGLDSSDDSISDLWEFSLSWDVDDLYRPNGRWTPRTPVSSTVPDARSYHSMACLNGVDLLLFGGECNDREIRNDLWHFNDANSTWTVVMEPGSANSQRPARRFQQNMIQVGPTALMFGGLGQTGGGMADMWELIAKGYETNLIARWRSINTRGPSFRHKTTMVEMSGGVFMFGGFHSGDFLNDLWFFSACVCVEGYQRGPFEDVYKCQTCPLNTYKDTTELKPCSKCPVRSYSDPSTGASSVWNCTCESGYYRELSTKCSSCPPGTYKLDGNSPCFECAAGSFSALSAASGCSLCQSGSQSAPGSPSCKCVEGYARQSWACVPCMPGSYKDHLSNDPCTLCPRHSNSGIGSISVLNCSCPRGYSGERNGVSCIPCAFGYAKPAAGPGLCTICPPGTYTLLKNASTECILCPPGKFSNVSGHYFSGEQEQHLEMACTPCPEASLTTAPGAHRLDNCTCGRGYEPSSSFLQSAALPSHQKNNDTLCLPCPKGSYQSIIGFRSCSLCEPGTFSDLQAASACQDCPHDTYSQRQGSWDCTLCPFDHKITEIVVQGKSTFTLPTYYRLISNESQCWSTCNGILSCTGSGFSARLTFGNVERISGMYEPWLETTTIAGAEITDYGVGYNPSFRPQIECLLRAEFIIPLKQCFNGTIESNATRINCTMNSSSGTNNAPGPWDLFNKKIGVYLQDLTWAGARQELLAVVANTVSSPLASTKESECSCAPGYHGGDVSSCKPCAPGAYKDFIGPGVPVLSNGLVDFICRGCEAGKYGELSAQVNCSLCPRNTFSRSVGATEQSTCQDCPTNSQSPEGSSIRYNCSCNAGYTSDGGILVGPDLTFFRCRPCYAGLYKDWAGKEMCKECPDHSSSLAGSARLVHCTCIPGYTGPNGTVCVTCKPGKFKPTSGPQECTLCPQGKYSAAIGAVTEDTCLPCPKNKTTLTAGMQFVATCKCQAGFGPLGQDCGACTVGTYKSSIGDYDCDLCAAGTFSDRIGTKECSNCPGGTYRGASGGTSSKACLPCSRDSDSAAGSVVAADCLCNKGFSGPEGGPCLACTLGTYKKENGSALCTLCPANTYSETFASENLDSCLGCPNLTRSVPGSRDKKNCVCLPGYSGANGGPCIACLPGTYKQINGSSACVSCAAGKYSPTPTAISDSTCELCPSDSHSAEGSINVLQCMCNLGYTGVPPSPCAPCLKGSYKATVGSLPCDLCVSGTYLSGIAQAAATNCNACPANTTSNAGSSNITQCICIPGYSGINGEACTPCPSGTYKASNGSETCISCNAGTYSAVFAATSSITCLNCHNNSFSRSRSTDITDCKCIMGYTGPDGVGCRACSAGFFKQVNGSDACLACPPGKYNTLKASLSEKACSACLNSSYSPAGSDSLTDCICNAGYTGLHGQPCTPCVGGWKSANGSSACVLCMRGKYSLASSALSPDICYPCREFR